MAEVMTVDLKTLLTVLIAKGIAKYEAQSRALPIPPGYTFKITGTVDSTSVAFGVMAHIVVSADHAISMKSIIDNITVGEDDDVVQESYPIPRIMYEYGALVPVKRFSEIILTNKSTNTVTVNYSWVDVTIPKMWYDKIIESYFDTILEGVDRWKESVQNAVVELL